ncbi:hypothetical protein JST97_03250 [bacterium]|nr:hypothetical protein [bacterium]
MKRKGFGLLETLLAITLLTLSVLLLCNVLTTALKLSSQNRESTVAALSAQQILEQIRAGVTPPTGASTFDGANPDPPTSQGFPPAPYPSQDLDGRIYTYRVETRPFAGKPGLYDITLSVNWSGGHRAVLESHVFLP